MILAFDCNHMIHSLWYAQGGIGVLSAVRNRIDAVATRLQPQHVVACFDHRSFRYDIYPQYKAGRKDKPEGLLRDLADAPEAFMDVATIAQEEGFEADDCLASLAALAPRIGLKCVITSPDKDLRQCLVDGQVTILKGFTLSGAEVTSMDWYTTRRLEEECKLIPMQWPDYQALVGDTTDNIPGCVGWGPKITGAVMAAAGSLKAILANPLALKLTAKQAAALMKFKPMVDVILKLVTLRTDVAAVVDAVR